MLPTRCVHGPGPSSKGRWVHTTWVMGPHPADTEGTVQGRWMEMLGLPLPALQALVSQLHLQAAEASLGVRRRL